MILILKKIHNIFYILLGLFLIIYPFYKKLLKVRLPMCITDINIYIAIWILFIYIFLVISLIFIIIKKTYFPNRPQNKLLLWFNTTISTPISNYYWKSMWIIDNYIKDNLINTWLGPFLLRLTKHINQYLYGMNMKKYIKVLVIFHILPRVILLIIFIFDVLYLNKFHYIYIFSWLFVIPLLFKYVMFTFKEFSEFNIKFYCEEILSIPSLTFADLHYQDFINESHYIYRSDTLKPETSTDVVYTHISLRSSFIHDYMPKNSLQNDIDRTCAEYVFDFNQYIFLGRTIFYIDRLKEHIYFTLYTLVRFCIYTVLWSYVLFVICVNMYTSFLISVSI